MSNVVDIVPVTRTEVARQDSVFLPVMSMDVALARRNTVVEFTKKIMVQDQDFGTIPGTNKPTLLKPGAEKLCNFFGLEPEFTPIIEDADWTGEKHSGEMFYYVRYRVRLMREGRVLGVGEGSCNSWESKYRWRQSSRKCPQCGGEFIIAGKQEYGGGWLCYKKKGGCGQKFNTDDPAISGQSVGRVPNPDIADVVNTIQKMAQKRALVAATLIATSASEFFTQDVEDQGPAYEPEEASGNPVGSKQAQNDYLREKGIEPTVVEKPAKAKKGAIAFDALKKWGELKKDVINTMGDSDLYYTTLLVYGYKHSNEIQSKEDATAIWKLIGAGLNKAKQDADLLKTLQEAGTVLGAETFDTICNGMGIDEIMALDSDALAFLLQNLKATADARKSKS